MRTNPKKSPWWARALGAIFYVLFLGVVLAGGTIWGWVNQNPLMGKLIQQQVFGPKDPKEVFEGRDSLTLLVLGCDEDRYYQGARRNGVRTSPTLKNGSPVRRKYARSDMILVAKLDFRTNQITGVSIPRDTECQLPGYRPMKINAYHAIAPDGQQATLTKQAVEYLLPGVQIDRVVTLDFDAFQRMVDVAGGVTVEIEKRMKYDDYAGNVHIDFYPGVKKLDGYEAMMYVRYRHGDNDFKRQERQKQFLASFKGSVLTNVATLPKVLTEAQGVMNNALSTDELAALAFFAKAVPQSSIRLGQIQTRDGRGTNLLVDQDKLYETLAEFNLTSDSGTRVGFDR